MKEEKKIDTSRPMAEHVQDSIVAGLTGSAVYTGQDILNLMVKHQKEYINELKKQNK